MGVGPIRRRQFLSTLGAGLASAPLQLALGDPDPHGLTMLDGKRYFCDAGSHPGWERDNSPHTGWVSLVDVL